MRAADRLERRRRCPVDACGSKNVASSEQMTMSASLTKYCPPPAHMPCTAATTGFHTCGGTSAPSMTPGSKLFQTLRWYEPRRPRVTSTPVQNARSPFGLQHDGVDVVGVAHDAPTPTMISAAIASLNEFNASGRSRVIVATWSCDLEGDRRVLRARRPPVPQREARFWAVSSLWRANMVAAWRCRSMGVGGMGGRPTLRDGNETVAVAYAVSMSRWLTIDCSRSTR